MATKNVYSFGGGKADGNGGLKNLLGGKGANLAEMAGHKNLRLPVPPGFTITTEVCTHYYENEKSYPKGLKEDVEKALKEVEKISGKKFGDSTNPLLVSVRSGARSSMPGMMETVLNVGLTAKTIVGLTKMSNDERFAYDAYRRLIMMYSDVVMEKAADIEPAFGLGIRKELEEIMAEMKKKKGVKLDTDLSASDLKTLCELFKIRIKKVLKKEFPDDAEKQLWGGISAVFSSWQGKRAKSYRAIENIPDEWGTAVNVQAMVFGNMGDDSATGVAFTRNPGNGDNNFYGEYLVNAQGEDVVAGIRTPAPLNSYSRSEHNKELKTLEEIMPSIYKELDDIQNRLEKHYHDMQDIEFTIERGKLYMLQCRSGKRNGPAALKMAMDMVKEKLIDEKTAVMRVTPSQLDELLYPIIDPKLEAQAEVIAKGLPAGPGGASGAIVLSSEEAVKAAAAGKSVILVREETNPEDVEGMRAAEAILTARGGMTSHAALVARGWGKCCIVGCGAVKVDHKSGVITIGETKFKRGDLLTLNGTKGCVYSGALKMMDAASENKLLQDFLKICDRFARLGVRTNADTPADAKKARAFGAKGIGLFRTEHMFYGENSELPLFHLRKMIVAKTEEEQKKALAELFPFVKKDISALLKEMEGLPVTFRLLDPPLHEFVPKDSGKQKEIAKALNISIDEFKKRADSLHESNPMMGHRGVRLGITHPEVTKMQIRAILESAYEMSKKGSKTVPEIMIPVVGLKNEIADQKVLIAAVHDELCRKFKVKKIEHKIGTMIEIPRACITAGAIAEEAEFFSFGTNDLTQMGFGFSRDDMGGFLPVYLEKKILPADPFQTVDQEGIGELIKIAVEKGRKNKPNLKIGICGEQGGDPLSVEFLHQIGLNYVSCSPFRVPTARLAAAQAEINFPSK